MIDKYLQRIKKCTDFRPKLQEPMLGLVEEVGEVAQAINVENHYKNKKLKETSAEECVDVLISSIELFIERGGTDELLDKKLKQKISRWEKRIEERKKGDGCDG